MKASSKELLYSEYRSEIKSVYANEDPKVHCTREGDDAKILKLIKNFRFIKNFRNYTLHDQLDLARSFKKTEFKPGERPYVPKTDSLDSFNIILQGRVGIYYQDHAKLRKLCED